MQGYSKVEKIHNNYAVAAWKNSNIIGHIPREISLKSAGTTYGRMALSVVTEGKDWVVPMCLHLQMETMTLGIKTSGNHRCKSSVIKEGRVFTFSTFVEAFNLHGVLQQQFHRSLRPVGQKCSAKKH